MNNEPAPMRAGSIAWHPAHPWLMTWEGVITRTVIEQFVSQIASDRRDVRAAAGLLGEVTTIDLSKAEDLSAASLELLTLIASHYLEGHPRLRLAGPGSHVRTQLQRHGLTAVALVTANLTPQRRRTPAP